MVALEQLAPGAIAELGGPLGRADDVREEHRRQNAVRNDRELLARDEALDLVGSLRREEDLD